MSIQRENYHYILVCDICQNAAEAVFDTWGEAVDFKIDNGWKAKTEGGGWIDICPDCQE